MQSSFATAFLLHYWNKVTVSTFFESHARASDGMPNVNGKNILLKKTNITGIFLTFA